MFAVYAVIMAWALFEPCFWLSGSEWWWLGLASAQIYWTVAIVRQWRKYRHLPLQELHQAVFGLRTFPAQNETLILSRSRLSAPFCWCQFRSCAWPMHWNRCY